MKHVNCQRVKSCGHEELRYCEAHDVVWCEGCGKEWESIYKTATGVRAIQDHGDSAPNYAAVRELL